MTSVYLAKSVLSVESNNKKQLWNVTELNGECAGLHVHVCTIPFKSFLLIKCMIINVYLKFFTHLLCYIP